MNIPRMRTADLPGCPFQLNGVEIPVEQWNVDHGGHLGSEAPVRVQLTFFARFEPEPETAEQRRERLQQEAAAALTAAAADWQTALDRLPAMGAVLDLHHPQSGYQRVDCAHCEQHDGMESTENVPWPCPTYAAITGTPKQAGEPEQRPLAPIEITLTVQSGLSDRQLHDAISDAIRRQDIYRPTRTR